MSKRIIIPKTITVGSKIKIATDKKAPMIKPIVAANSTLRIKIIISTQQILQQQRVLIISGQNLLMIYTSHCFFCSFVQATI